MLVIQLDAHKEMYAKSPFKFLPWSDLKIEFSNIYKLSYNLVMRSVNASGRFLQFSTKPTYNF